MDDESSKFELPYQSADPPQKRRQSPALIPLLLCLPGAICWLHVGSRWLFLPYLRWILLPFRIRPDTLLWMWPTAVVTAIVSLVLYTRRRPLAWYHIVNLVINISGLVLTAVIVGLIVWLLMRQ